MGSDEQVITLVNWYAEGFQKTISSSSNTSSQELKQRAYQYRPSQGHCVASLCYYIHGFTLSRLCLSTNSFTSFNPRFRTANALATASRYRMEYRHFELNVTRSCSSLLCGKSAPALQAAVFWIIGRITLLCIRIRMEPAFSLSKTISFAETRETMFTVRDLPKLLTKIGIARVLGCTGHVRVWPEWYPSDYPPHSPLFTTLA